MTDKTAFFLCEIDVLAFKNICIQICICLVCKYEYIRRGTVLQCADRERATKKTKYEKTMKSIGQILKQYRDDAGLSAKEVGELTEFATQPTVGRIENGQTKNPGWITVSHLLKVYNRSVEELYRDMGLEMREDRKSFDRFSRKVPVLHDMDQVPDFIIRRIKPDTYTAVYKDFGHNCFGVIQPNETMQTADRRSIPQGATVIIDPNIEPETGDIVLVSMKASGRVLLKKLVDDGDDRWLANLNPQFQNEILLEQSTTLGTAVSVQCDLRG